MSVRRRFKQQNSLEERLIRHANELREKARTMPAGAERERLLRKAKLDETTARMRAWLGSPAQNAPMPDRHSGRD